MKRGRDWDKEDDEDYYGGEYYSVSLSKAQMPKELLNAGGVDGFLQDGDFLGAIAFSEGLLFK